MSADLFAQFGPFSGGSAPASPPNPPPGGQPSQKPQAEDPFAFLSSALAQPPSQPGLPQQRQAQWTAPASAALSWPASGSGDGVAWGTPAMTAPPAPSLAATGGDGDDDDAWGDFEEAASGAQAQQQAQPAALAHTPSQAVLPLQTWPQMQPQPQPPARTRVRAPTIDLMTNTLVRLGDGPAALGPLSSAPVLSGSHPPPPKPKKPSDPDVLFDAEEYDGTESISESGDDDDDDDEFGDFETGHASPPPPPSKPTTASRAVAAPTPAAATALVDLLSLSDPDPPASTAGHPAAPGPAPLTKSQQAASLLSPLSFGGTSSPAATVGSASHPLPPKSPSFKERNPFPGLAVTTPNAAAFPSEQVRNRTPSPVTTWPSFDPPAAGAAKPPLADDWDAWDAVDTGPPEAAAGSQKGQKDSAPAPTPGAAAAAWDWEAEEPTPAPEDRHDALPPGIANSTEPKNLPDSTPPPTNVPPPSILLSLFPSLMAMPDEALFKPTAALPADARNRILGHPKTISFLRNYLQIITVAARVVAGRKHRWHRDKFLAQSMSISAAGSSRGGGMKLAGIDKAQGQREDREAADVVAVWLRHVGKVRSAVATANAALAAVEAAEHKHMPPLRVPELQSATVPVTTAKGVPTAPRPCIVCGLRRDERLRGVDGDDVQDLFGEWWVEHWGHRQCRNFWAEHEATLRSR